MFENILEKIINKTETTCQRIGNAIPYIPQNGRYPDLAERGLSWWCNGFFAGMLWQLYNANKNPIFREKAEGIENRLDEAFHDFVGLHHDVGFMWLHTAVANYRLTGNEQSKKRGLHAANLLAGRFNHHAGFINAWNNERTGWMIIDTMMNLPLLYWAKETANLPHYGFIATAHAYQASHFLLRPDGSCNHIIILDQGYDKTPYRDNPNETPAGQGYASGSSWTRGAAWSVYGFALSYLHSKDTRFLNCAKTAAHYFIANLDQNLIPPIDFRQPKEPRVFDTTAGLIAACGFLEIAKHVGENEKDLYFETARNIVLATEKQWADWNHDNDGIIGGGSEAYNKPETYHVPIIYGDYFFTEAVLRILEKDFLIW
ncbi:MAG: glycoside hydrolase family 88 protein [Defluviitaleaceae bacterium]|nr:glycoside hydrolase family 88 protein [Defluviitaleaceae bacterium]